MFNFNYENPSALFFLRRKPKANYLPPNRYLPKLVVGCPWDHHNGPRGRTDDLNNTKRTDGLWRLVKDGITTELTNTHTARGFSVLHHVFARKQCAVLRHKCYLTLPSVTSLRDSFWPWNFRARIYYAAASKSRVFARLLVGNKDFTLRIKSLSISVLWECAFTFIMY